MSKPLSRTTGPMAVPMTLAPCALVLVLGLLMWTGPARAQGAIAPLPSTSTSTTTSTPATPPSPVVALSASATADVPQDWLTLVLSTSRDGAEAGAVQAQLRQALDSALAEARKAARPGQLEVHTGAFSLYPRHAAPRPGSGSAAIVGWQGTAELVLQGRDVAAIGQLAGRIASLSVARVGFSLSREAREKVEADLTAQAIARFRERAGDIARGFGLPRYALREVQVSGQEPAPPVVRALALRAQPGLAMAESALPLEAGQAVVSVSVSGTVQLLP